jgi:16S rRNA (cytosine1402-N4)-methyltransferase
LLTRFPEARVIGLDRDPAALARSRERLERFGDRVRLERSDFADMEAALTGAGVSVTGVLLDLGVSSLQLDDPRRGFSYLVDGPLNMSLGGEEESGAAALLAEIEEGTLTRIFRELGELPGAGRAARAVLDARDRGALTHTAGLVEALGRAGVRSPRRLSQAFQALRLASNDELGSLARGLDAAGRVLPAGGTLTVISFESLMDRMVKRTFQPARSGRPIAGAEDPLPRWRLLTRGAVRPSQDEVARNPRARSARLRAAERTGHD